MILTCVGMGGGALRDTVGKYFHSSSSYIPDCLEAGVEVQGRTIVVYAHISCSQANVIFKK